MNPSNNFGSFGTGTSFGSADTGDVILTPSPSPKQKKSSKIPLIIIAVVVLLAAIIGFLVYQFVGRANNSNEKVIAVLTSSNVGNLESLEQIYYDAYYGDINIGELFDEQTYNNFINDTNATIELQKELAKFNASFVDSNVRDEFRDVQTKLSKRAPKYQQVAELVQVFYEAYTKNEPDLIQQYLEEDSPAYMAANRFKAYFEEEESLNNLAKDNNCELDNTTSTCVYISERQNENKELLLNGFMAVQSLLFAYEDDTIYTDNILIYDNIEDILDKLEESNEG